METSLSITNQYPASKYNLLGNTDVIVNIPDIKSPVVQAIKLDSNPDKGDVYIQKKPYTDQRGNKHPAEYAITKNGLNKLANGAGITMVRSEHLLPATCQKCAAVNQSMGKALQCGSCKNRDIAFRVTIAVPQLTGDIIYIEDTNEIIVENVTAGMSESQKAEFLKHLPQICEAKALNGAIRTALHIKGTYTKEELDKPFVVAYLVPNLNNEQVKTAAINNMFQSSTNLYGKTPTIQQIETRVPETPQLAIEASDGENIDQYIDGTYSQIDTTEPQADSETETVEPAQAERSIEEDYCCDKCGEHITEKVWNYSVEKFERPLCYKCQQIVRKEQK